MKSGARLPLLLLLNYIIAVAGVLIWVMPSAPETLPLAVAVPAEKKAHEKQASDSNTAAENRNRCRRKSNRHPLQVRPKRNRGPNRARNLPPRRRIRHRRCRNGGRGGRKRPDRPFGHHPTPDKLEPAENSQKTVQKTAPKSIDKRRARPDLPIVLKALPRAVSDAPYRRYPTPGWCDDRDRPLPGWVMTEDGRSTFTPNRSTARQTTAHRYRRHRPWSLGCRDRIGDPGPGGRRDACVRPLFIEAERMDQAGPRGRTRSPDQYPNGTGKLSGLRPRASDPLTSLKANSNLDRLFWALSRATAMSAWSISGSRFTVSRTHMVPVLKALKQRGLMYLDSGSTSLSIAPAVARQIGMSFAASALTLDERASRKDIDQKFGELKNVPGSKNRRLGSRRPIPSR